MDFIQNSNHIRNDGAALKPQEEEDIKFDNPRLMIHNGVVNGIIPLCIHDNLHTSGKNK